MKRFILVIIFGVLFFTLISCKRTNLTEKEPNNDFFASNRAELDSTIEGRLDTPQDHDFYRFDIINPVIVDIELSPVKGLNHAVKIWKDSGQKLLKYVDDSRKSSPERMCNMFFNMGTYYIEVLHGDRDIPQGNAENYYQLRLTVREWYEEEFESNDNYEESNLLEPGREVKGYFSPSFNKLNSVSSYREEDWYYFDVDLIDDNPMILDINLSGVPGVDSSLYLLDADRNEIASSNIGNTGDGELLEGIGITKTGKYYIMVTSNFESNNNIPYTLHTALMIYDYSSEIEPNNNFENANLIMGDEITGRIYPEGDKDYFLFAVQNNDMDNTAFNEEQMLYKIEALSEGLDLVMKIFDENRIELFEIDNIKTGGKEVTPNAFLKDIFYIEVSSKRGESQSLEYKLKISYFPFSENYEIEPNDTKETATRIKSNRITGFVSKKDDIDYYLLEYKNRVKKRLILYGIENSELKISITDPLGFIIKTESVKDSNTISFYEMIDLKGYLIVESKSDNYEEPYTVELGD